ALVAPGEVIGREHLRFGDLDGAAASDDRIVSLGENEKNYLERVLRATGGRVEDAAKALGIARSSLYDRLRRHRLNRPRGRRPGRGEAARQARRRPGGGGPPRRFRRAAR